MKEWLRGICGVLVMDMTWAAGWGLVGGGLMELLVDPTGSIVDVRPSSREAKIRRS